MEKSDPRPHGIFDSFTGTPSEPAGSSELRSQRLSLSSMSNALPSQIVLNNTFPLSTVDEAMHPHAASSSEAILDCSSRMDTESGDSPRENLPPSYPGSPTAFDSLHYIHTSASDRGFLRVNSFDSTAATVGSPLPRTVSGYDSPFHPASPIRIQNLVVMRHSERMDDADSTWTATSERPWDPPITERGKQMAAEAGRKLRSEVRSIHRMVVSPFLRCVQTAAEVVQALMAAGSTRGGPGVEGPASDSNQILVSIEYGVGEIMNPASLRITSSSPASPVSDPRLSWILPLETLGALLPPGSWDRNEAPVMSAVPKFPETAAQAFERYSSTLNAVCDRHPESDILCITHGEGVSVSVSRLLLATVYEVRYNAFSWSQRLVKATCGEEVDSKPAGDWRLMTESGSTGISWLVSME